MNIRDLTDEEKDVLKKEIDRIEAEIFIKREKLDSDRISPAEAKIIDFDILNLTEELATWQAEYNLGIYFPHRWGEREKETE